MKITQELVKRLFDYNPDGYLIWKVKPALRVSIGSPAGSKNTRGYWQVRVLGKLYRSHRIIFLWHNGYFPENNIDHIDGNPSNNKIENLREVTQQCNLRNSKVHKNNNSGVTGVIWHKQTEKWYAQIKVNGKNINLGFYSDFISAVKARHTKEIELEWNGCNSSSSAYLFLADNGLL
jgi:hypothetical protein